LGGEVGTYIRGRRGGEGDTQGGQVRSTLQIRVKVKGEVDGLFPGEFPGRGQTIREKNSRSNRFRNQKKKLPLLGGPDRTWNVGDTGGWSLKMGGGNGTGDQSRLGGQTG